MTKNSKRYLLIILIYIAFISLGLPDGLLGVIWSKIRTSFSLPLLAVLAGMGAGALLFGLAEF